MKSLLMPLAVAAVLIAPLSSALAIEDKDIIDNPGVTSMWMSSGPCNHKNSFAWSEVQMKGKWATVDRHPLDCNKLITMVMANGRISYLFSNGKRTIGFATDGKVRHDEKRQEDYLLVDHFYPYDMAIWRDVSSRSGAEN
jgi:hypothetical protein